MAVNGSKSWDINTSLWQVTGRKFYWERISYSIQNNTSTIKWIYYQTVSGYIGVPTSFTHNYTVTIDGESFSGQSIVVYENGDRIIASGILVIPHDAKGQKTFFVSTYDDGENSGSYNMSFTLDAIPRLTRLDRVWDFTDKENPRIALTQYQQTYPELGLAFGDKKENPDIPYKATGITLTDAGTEYIRELTEGERAILWTKLKEGTSTPIRYYLRYTIEGEYYYDVKVASLIFPDYAPTLSPIVEATAGDRTYELTGDSSGNTLIRYYSDVEFSTGAGTHESAYIENQYVRCGGQIIAGNMPEGTIEDVWSGDFEFSVTDSNGYTTTQTLNKTIVPYIKLTCSIESAQLDTNGNLTFTIVGKYFNGSFGAKNNTFEVSYDLKENGEDMYEKDQPLGIVTPTVDAEGNYRFTYTIRGLNHVNQYRLIVYAYDEITPAQSLYAYTVLGNVSIFDWGKDDFNFNVPVYLNNTDIPLENLADYVRIQGSSGNWFYRQWYSGKVELWGVQEISDMACNIALGGWYRTAVNSSPYFPFTINNPQVTVNYESDGFGALVWPTTQSSTSKPFDYYLIRPTSSTGISGKLIFHVIGDQGAQIL